MYMETNLKKKGIRLLFDEAFPDNPEWNGWFFENVYKDDEAFLLTDGDLPVSCLFMQRYSFRFHGEPVGLSYVSGVATKKAWRGQGQMSNLLREALSKVFDRDDVFAGIIPASRRLYFFYDKFDFATVVYNVIERYSSLHTFTLTEGYSPAVPTYAAFAALHDTLDSTIVHSEKDYLNILDDIKLDNGVVVQVNDPDGRPAAMAFATSDNSVCWVKYIVGNDPAAREMCLAEIKRVFGDIPFEVFCSPSHFRGSFSSRGMIRVINAEKALDVIARKFPAKNMTFKVEDSLIEENNGIFAIKDGHCEKVKTVNKKPDIDVDIAVLSKLLFSSERIGEIFDLPASHPQMPLMLD